MADTPPKIYKLLFLCILLFSGLIRVISLTNIPYVVHGDEAIIGLEAIKVLNISHVKQLFETGWYGYPQLTFLLPALPIQILGESLFALRFASVLLGMVSIVLMYFFISKIRNATEAVIAATLLGFSHMHIHFSRTGFHYMQGLLFSQASLFLFLLALQKQKPVLFFLSGVITGLGFHVYLSARVAICVIAIVYVVSFFCKKLALISYKQVGFFLAGFIITILPILFLNDRAWTANSRSNQVFLFNNSSHLTSVYNTTNWIQIIKEQLIRVSSFMFRGRDSSEQYGIVSAGVDIFTMTLSGIGIIMWVYKQIHKQHNITLFVAFLWLSLVLVIGGVLTIDAPFYPRLLPAIVPISLFAAYAISTISKHRLSFLIWTCLLCVCLLNLKIYFMDFPQRRPYKNSLNYTVLAKALKKEECKNVILISNPQEFMLHYDTVRYLAPETSGLTIDTVDNLEELVIANQPTCIVISVDDSITKQQMKLHYSNWIWKTVSNPYKEKIFYFVMNRITK